MFYELGGLGVKEVDACPLYLGVYDLTRLLTQLRTFCTLDETVGGPRVARGRGGHVWSWHTPACPEARKNEAGYEDSFRSWRKRQTP